MSEKPKFIDIEHSVDPAINPLVCLYPLVLALFDKPSAITGAIPLVDFYHNIFGPMIPSSVLDYSKSIAISSFGGLPEMRDIAPCAIFCGVFFILLLLHATIFIVNFRRGHYFFLSFAWMVACTFRILGFALRAYWGTNFPDMAAALTGSFFQSLPTLLIISADLVLAQRLFTWRHPVGGSRKLFWYSMFNIYVLVCIMVIVFVIVSFEPAIHFISEYSRRRYYLVLKIASIGVVLFPLSSIILVGLSYWAPTKKDEMLYTYQPWWIESFHPLYFVKKGAAKEAEETFMKRTRNHRNAIRVIASTHHNYNTVQGLTNERGDLKHNVSIWIVGNSSLLIFISGLLGCILAWQEKQNFEHLPLAKPVAMYICVGLFEFIIHMTYIVGRVDLRFYRPDVLPAKIRELVTGQISQYASDSEEAGEASGDQSSSIQEQNLPYPVEKKYLEDERDSSDKDLEKDLSDKDLEKGVTDKIESNDKV